MNEWVKRWGYEVQPTTTPGVHKLRDGGFLVHGKISEQGRKRTVSKLVREGTMRDAQRERALLLQTAKASQVTSTSLFAGYAKSLYERKVELREIKSAKTRERWDTTLRLHLVPAFGRFAVDAISKLDIERWKTKLAKKIRRKKLSPRTANGWLSILRVIIRSAVDDFELERDPTLRVKDFSIAEHPTYTEEEPNALTPEQARRFLRAMHKKFPQFYAMTLLGFVTGLRPSTLRPLRRNGDHADVSWSAATLLVRRSNSLGEEIMDTTKTEIRYTIGLPADVMTALQAHVALLKGSRKRSTLLFPSRVGGLMSRSALDKPFEWVSKKIALGFNFTPRGMRRTYQDVCRDQKIDRSVRKAVCGHATDAMSEHYSTVRPDEMRVAVAKISAAMTAPRKNVA